MPKFVKKPIVIEAVKWDGTTRAWDDLEALGLKEAEISKFPAGIVIPTLEGNMLAMSGDWIIRGVKGEFYPCKPDIFEATYDPVEE